MNQPDSPHRSDVDSPGNSVGVLLRLLTVLLIFLGTALIWQATSTAAQPQQCHVRSSPPTVSSAVHPSTTLTALDKRTADPPRIDFGLSRSDKPVAPYSYAVTGAAPDPAKISWNAVLVRGNDEFPTDHVGVTFSFDLGQLQVTVCLKGAGLTAGTYAGGISFVGADFKAQLLPMTITLKDDNLWHIWIGIVIATAAAVFFKWWSTQIADPDKGNKPSLSAFGGFLREQWVTVLIGVVAAVGAVYRSAFMNTPTFVPGDRWKLWTAVFTAVTASTLLVNAIGRTITKGGNQPGERSMSTAHAEPAHIEPVHTEPVHTDPAQPPEPSQPPEPARAGVGS